MDNLNSTANRNIGGQAWGKLQFKNVSFLNNFIGNRFSSALTETIFTTALGVLLGYCFLPDTPFFATQGFTWLMIGPLLSGLRYGFVFALFSLLLLLGLLLTARFYQMPWATGPLSSIFFPLIWIAFIAGEFRNYWERRINKLKVSNQYHEKKLNEVSQAYCLTKISHDRLQELMVTKVSLRNTILEVRKQIMKADLQNGRLQEVTAIILRSLADYGNIQEASLHEVNNNQLIKPEATDSIGYRFSVNLNDPLLIEAIRTRKTVSLKSQLITEHPYDGTLLLAIPLADSLGRIWGIVAVHKMPFRSYSPENLNSISILASYIGDILGKRICSPFPEARDINLHEFLLQIHRCIQDMSEYSVPSVLMGFEFKNKQNSELILLMILERKRDLDQTWIGLNQDNNRVLFLLLPLTTDRAVEAYKTQLQDLLENNFSFLNFQAAKISLSQRILLPTDNAIGVIKVLSAKLNIKIPLQTNQVERNNYAGNQ